MEFDRTELSDAPLEIDSLYQWAVLPQCGAVVLFSGTVRDHADGRNGVESLTYEAYHEVALRKMQEVIDEARRRFPTLGRVGIVHRVGRLSLSESAVVVVVSAPHRPEAFDAARYCIDAVKQSVPIWKKEEWQAQSAWGTRAHTPIGATNVSVVEVERTS